ncbi:asparagine synthetase A [Clostridium sp.]
MAKLIKEEIEILEIAVAKIKNKKIKDILFVQQSVLKAVDDFMYKRRITRILPLMMSPITDTLNHSVEDCELTYNKQKFDVMKSMIFHKQLTMLNSDIDSLYIVSPNIRLEMATRGDSRHLFEFTQVDFEFKDGTMEGVLKFIEEIITYIFKFVKENCIEELTRLGVGTDHLNLSGPFEKYSTDEMKEKYGDDFEAEASKASTQPFFLTNHKREFYDAEDLDELGTYRNYDLIWPLGFGEGLSGGEREYKLDRILLRMRELATDEHAFRYYIELAKRGELFKTAGAGFGVERITRFITQQPEVSDVTLFCRKPGEQYIF